MKTFKDITSMVREETDTSEKIEMTQSQLHFIHYACEEILEFIEDGGEVEEWYQVKVAKAFSEFESLHSYMEGEKRRTGMVDEEVDPAHKKILDKAKTSVPKMPKNEYDRKVEKYLKKKYTKEEVEQIDELSKGTLASYAKKATNDSRIKMGIGKDFERQALTSRKPGYKAAAKDLEDKYKTNARKREAGVGKAIDRLAKEEVEQIDELSKKTLGSYLKSATHDVAAKGAATRQFAIDSARKSSEQDYDGARKSMQKSDKTFSQSWKRRNNMAKAVDRLTKEEVEQIDEKNVPTSPEKWAQAKSQAKAKFDVYPSAYANGWAAKKYKEMGGGWKSVNEAKDDAPFEGGKPVSSKKSVVPGKYGAGFSTAKHLAKTAMKKQVDKMKKPVKEEVSSKAKIVKDIMKKKKTESADTFQKDPIISKTEVRM